MMDPPGRYDRPRPIAPTAPTLFDPDPPSLFPATGGAPAFVAVPSTGGIEATFLAFHRANPWVYDALVRLARDLKKRGRHRQGIGMLFEVLRWQWFRTTIDPSSDFRLNNNYRSRYARLIMEREADLDDVFETRVLTAP